MTTSGTEGLLIDAVMPTCDATIAEHVIVAADPARTFRAVRALDLLTVRTPLLSASIWLRNLPAVLSGRATPPVPRVVVGEGLGLPGWVLLGEREDREIVLGAVGRFWRPVIEWRDVAAEHFGGFDEPGWGKIAANFSVTPYGGNTLLSYQCRTLTTDSVSRRQFRRYWLLTRPFVAHIMRATVDAIKTDAEAPT